MTYDYSEDKLIEQTAIKLFEELGWESANVYHGETFGPDGTIGRNSEADIILSSRFYEALSKFNHGLPEQAYLNAHELITEESSTKSPAEINHEKYNYLRDGIPVTYKNEKGEIVRNKKLKVFDFDRPEENNFLAVQQLWVEGKSRRKKRPDVIGFVNELPLLFIELKAQ
jgi:type I restriction enzyme R subunit